MTRKIKDQKEKKSYIELEKELFKGGVTIRYGTRNPHEVLCEGIANYINQTAGRIVVRVKKRENE